jgi:uncharacterized coiled-coil protein SlyX
MKIKLFIIVLSVIAMASCWVSEAEPEDEMVVADTVEYYEEESIDSEDVIEAANERVTEKVMELLTPAQHIKALKNKMKAAKKIKDLDKREQNIMGVIHSAVLVEEYKLARNWVGDLKNDENKDDMLEMINTSIVVIKDGLR